jgi:hypothetical protein
VNVPPLSRIAVVWTALKLQTSLASHGQKRKEVIDLPTSQNNPPKKAFQSAYKAEWRFAAAL